VAHLRLAAPPSFRRLALGLSLSLALAEFGLFLLLWRVGMLAQPGSDRRAALAFVVLGSTFTIQAMVIVGIAWAFVAISRTTIEADDIGLTLEHPWRRWHGEWWAVRHAWMRNGWLTFELNGQWRRWYVRVASADATAVSEISGRLPAGVWLEGSALRAHYLRSILPILLGATGVGGLLMVIGLYLLRRIAGPN
jgi:hypothetical protein